ncbi:MAG TPA: quinone oxidoreductase [Steroidobacteraceae bacterium]|nr:quinone oxidoreductase [Steroidobacteraceae bacterium]HRX89900.1 quinone oxidoreductase [Steroidobacteraceae bacterium]
MPSAIRLHTTGGPEVLQLESVDPGKPAAGQVLVKQTAVGLNYIDVYDRTGLYPIPMPGGLGREAAGFVLAVGPKVSGFKKGDRVAYVLNGTGAYCEVRNVPADRLVKLPKGVSNEQAAVLMLKGLTAHYLIRRTHRVQKGDTILVYAAAGGVGLLLVPWARSLGARVIGVVGNAAKAAIARKAGCQHVLLQDSAELAAAVRKLTKGVGVDVVYDSIGKDTFFTSLDCLRPRGLMVSYGNASGPVPPISILELTKRGSLFLTRPSLFGYIAARADLESAARETFAALKAKRFKVQINQRYALRDAAQAHRDLEARQTTGATVLLP